MLSLNPGIQLTHPSKVYTKEEKRNAIIEWLTERHLDIDGGYPHDHIVISGYLIIADLDDAKERNRTLIQKYRISELVRWYDRAVSYFNEGDCDFGEALRETMK